MEHIGVSLIVDGNFKNGVMPKEMISDLAEMLRNEGKTMVHFAKESVEAEGIVILAKGSKHSLMVLPNVNE